MGVSGSPEIVEQAGLEIEDTGKLSEELRTQIFGDAESANLWKSVDKQPAEGLAQDLGVPFPR
jgi:hypothetical protein